MKQYFWSIFAKEKKKESECNQAFRSNFQSVEYTGKREEQVNHHHKEAVTQIHLLGQMMHFLQQINGMTKKEGWR